MVNRTVRIHQMFTIVLGQDGQEVARAPLKTQCSDQDQCPIAKKHGQSISYDWAKCAFVKKTK